MQETTANRFFFFFSLLTHVYLHSNQNQICIWIFNGADSGWCAISRWEYLRKWQFGWYLTYPLDKHAYLHVYTFHACATVRVCIYSCACSESTGWWRPIGCFIFIGHFPRKSPIISGFSAENDQQLKAFYGASPPWSTGTYLCIYIHAHIQIICTKQYRHTNTGWQRGISLQAPTVCSLGGILLQTRKIVDSKDIADQIASSLQFGVCESAIWVVSYLFEI